ncbi:hypothetical protein AAFF_G00023910 [Aldrovandia affinis]|uniref:FYVE-type domain-containing protein n=1 Tax=Aldrovandia affinis TaxID=143900 RepID=A0AAD7WZP9_9TELE|nr:hypothetical protein AAFF_G00023910 [Aldrovandia affinis]
MVFRKFFKLSVRGCWRPFSREGVAMQGSGEQALEGTNRPAEDDMAEGDLGDGQGRKPGGLYVRRREREEAPDTLPQAKGSVGNGTLALSWTSCSALYTVFRRELEAGQPRPSWRLGRAESLSDLSIEELRQRMQEASEEVELLRCELEATQRHLEGKHEALKILQSRAMFDKATTHTKTLLQKSEERNKALEKEVNALQWEITFNQVQFQNFDQCWKEKYDRVCNENKALSDTVGDRVRELQELRSENFSLSQQCLELVSMLNVQEKRAFQGTLPTRSNLVRDGTALELAVLGACHCSASARGQCPCPCARTAAASRKQVLQLKQELEVQRRKREEAYVMADAFRIAFEQQLKRKSDHVLRLAEAEGYLRKDAPLARREEAEPRAVVKGGSVSVAQRLRGMLQNTAEVKMSEDPAEILRNLVDLLNDKEEALAHQRKVSYMLARNTEELERSLLQLRGQDCGVSTRGRGQEGGDNKDSDTPTSKPCNTQGGAGEASDTQEQCPVTGENPHAVAAVEVLSGVLWAFPRMDSFFRAAVGGLDKLLDDFELSEEPDSRATAVTTCSVTSASLDPSHCFYGFIPKSPPWLGGGNATPSCPDWALKPVCDLVSDTGPLLLHRANSHDAFKDLDVVERQVDEGLLVDFDIPATSPATGARTAREGHGHLTPEEHFTSLSLLDIILPATCVFENVRELGRVASPSFSEALGIAERKAVEMVLQNGGCLESVPSHADDGTSLCSTDGAEASRLGLGWSEAAGSSKVEEAGGGNSKKDDLEQELDCVGQLDHGWAPGQSNGGIFPSGSPQDRECSLSYLPVATSAFPCLVVSTEGVETGGLEDERVSSDCFVVGDTFVSQVQGQFVSGGKCGIRGGPAPTVTVSPEPLLEFDFTDDFLSESERANVLVTDEELDAFLKEQAERNGMPTEKHVDEGFSDMNGDAEGCPNPPSDYEDKGSKRRSLRDSIRQDSLELVAMDNDDSSFSSPSLDRGPCEVNLAVKELSDSTPACSSPNSDQYSYLGGVRPRQLQFSPRTWEAEAHKRSENMDAPPPKEVAANHICAPPPALIVGGDIPSLPVISSGHPHLEAYENNLGCDELSEPPPSPSPCTPEDLALSGDELMREDQGLGATQPSWVPDSDAPNCMNCLQKFTFTRRRHHCRACGKVYCGVCCKRKCQLKYLDKNARVCVICYEAIHRDNTAARTLLLTGPLLGEGEHSQVQAFERMMSPSGPSPNPNVPSEYCSTIPPLQQARAAGTLNSPPPTVMVPVSVLKHPGNEAVPREQRRVWFADGLLPNGEVADTTRLSAGGKRGSMDTSPIISEPPVAKGTPVCPMEDAPGDELDGAPAEAPGAQGVGPRAPVDGPWDCSLLCSVAGAVERISSLLPEDGEGLPPLLIITEEEHRGDVLVEERPSPSQILLLLEEGGPRPLTFVLNANLLVNLKLVTYCSRKCWYFSSNGLQGAGQQELVFLIQWLPEENVFPIDVFGLYVRIYKEVQSGRFVEELGSVTFTDRFLGSKEHGGFLFFSPTFQSLEGLSLPHVPFLCGVLIHKLEVPWAKVFPLRLLLRLGAEYSVYPTMLVSMRSRKAVYRETGHTIMNLLADLRNYQYSLPVVEGLQILMEMGNSYIHIPKDQFTQMLKVVNSSNEHVISVGASFSKNADSHLVCFQNEDGNYQTHANSMLGKTRTVTGASFVVFNGALKASSGFIAKSSIVEDGLMVQIPTDTMEGLRQALREQMDFQIPCGRADSLEMQENIHVRWVDQPLLANAGVTSPVDGRALDGALRVRMEHDTEFEMDGKTIKCTEVFYLPKITDCPVPAAPSPHSQLPRDIATATCIALCPHLTALKDSGINRLGLRVSSDTDMVEYQAGSGGACPAPALHERSGWHPDPRDSRQRLQYSAPAHRHGVSVLHHREPLSPLPWAHRTLPLWTQQGGWGGRVPPCTVTGAQPSTGGTVPSH